MKPRITFKIISSFWTYFALYILLFSCFTSTAQDKSPNMVLDGPSIINPKQPPLIVIRSSLGREILVDSLKKITFLKPEWVDSLKVYRPSSVEIVKYGDRGKYGVIFIWIKEVVFTKFLEALNIPLKD